MKIILLDFIGEPIMGKFNKVATTNKTNTINKAGGAAYEINDGKKALAGVVLNSMLKNDSFYQAESNRIQEVFALAKMNPEFAAKAMIYARQEGNLRSISHVLANAVVESASGSDYLRSAIKQTVVRPDDMTEMAALWFANHKGTMLPNSMRRAFKDLLESDKWNKFQLKRYLKERSNVKLKDIILLTHPKDKDGTFKAIIEGTLEAPKSLEAKLATGTKASTAFEELLNNGTLGYMAAMKNIRNALQTGLSDDALDKWCALVTNKNKVLKSRMLPFRYYDAWLAIKDLGIDHFKLAKVKAAINIAMIHSAHNLDLSVPNEKVALIVDQSGSMGWGSNGAWKHALTLAAVMYHAFGGENVVVYFFDSRVTKVDFGNKLPLEILESYNPTGGATYFHAPMQELVSTKTIVDKVVMLTDMQLYSGYSYGVSIEESFDTYWNRYRTLSPKVKMLFWNLEGYNGGTPLELKDNILMANGFSDKLLSIIPKMWVNQDALVDEIEAIKL
jgi:hypothetical protein